MPAVVTNLDQLPLTLTLTEIACTASRCQRFAGNSKTGRFAHVPSSAIRIVGNATTSPPI